MVPTVATIRSDVVRFLTNARLNVIIDGRTLDEMCGGMEDSVTLGRRRTNRLEQYDSWSKDITYIKKSNKYADTHFVFGLSTHHNVTEPLDVIIVRFLPPTEHYHASREIAHTTIGTPTGYGYIRGDRGSRKGIRVLYRYKHHRAHSDYTDVAHTHSAASK